MNRFFFIIVVVFFCSCTSKEITTEPQSSIPPAQLIEILTEMHKAEALSEYQDSTDVGRLKLFKLYKNQIFQKYKMTEASFDSGFVYYGNHPEMLDTLYDDIIEKLNIEEAKAN